MTEQKGPFQIIQPSEEELRRREIREMLERVAFRIELRQFKHVESTDVRAFFDERGWDIDEFMEKFRPMFEDIMDLIRLPYNHPKAKEIRSRHAKAEATARGWKIISDDNVGQK